jgi:cyclophilin family peptidyl-prolyl cis-trans isomerase/HEAT repeat protein
MNLRSWAVLTTSLGLLSACAITPTHNVRLSEDLRVPDDASLITTLTQGNPALRARAARAMARIQATAYTSPLIGALSDPHAIVRSEAAWALGQLRIDVEGTASPRLTDALQKATRDPDNSVRSAALEALGKSGGTDIEAHLRNHLTDPATTVRREATLGLFRLRYLKRIPKYSTPTVNALLRGLQDEDSLVRRWSAYGFSRWPEPRASNQLSRAATDTDPWTRLFSIRALGRLGEAVPTEILAQAQHDPQAFVRAEAVGALQKAKQADAILSTLITDDSPHVRHAVAGAEEDAGLLRKLLTDSSAWVRGRALERLAQLQKSATLSLIAEYAADADARLRAAALRAAKHLPESAFIHLRAGLDDSDITVQMAALEALNDWEVTEATGSATTLTDTPHPDALISHVLDSPSAPMELYGMAVELAGKPRIRRNGKLHLSTSLLPLLDDLYDKVSDREFIEVREGLVDTYHAFFGTAAFVAGPVPVTVDKLLHDPAPSVQAKAAKAWLRPEAPAVPWQASPFLENAMQQPTQLRLETTRGRIILELFWDAAPIHCANIVSLAANGTYTNTPWHRVVTNFVVQGGDPRGSGWGDAGYNIRDEINRKRYTRGTLGMPKAGKDTGGAQLFLTHIPTPHLDGRYTVFGRVVEGLHVMDRLEPGDRILSATPQ